MTRKNFFLVLIGVLLLFCLAILSDNFGFGGMNSWSLGITSSFGLIGVLIWTIAAIFWIWALLDCMENPALKGRVDKLAWIVVIVFLHVLGAVIYYLIMKSKKIVRKKAVVKVRRKTVKKKTKKRK